MHLVGSHHPAGCNAMATINDALDKAGEAIDAAGDAARDTARAIGETDLAPLGEKIGALAGMLPYLILFGVLFCGMFWLAIKGVDAIAAAWRRFRSG